MTYEQKLREKTRLQEEQLIDKQQEQVNRLAKMYRSYPLLKKEYSELCKKLYGRSVKKKWYSLNQIIQDIEDLKIELEKRS